MKDNQWEIKINQPNNNSLVIDYPYCWKPSQKDEKKPKPTIQLIIN